ncbi:DUF2141 domain-containing protein [Aquimarina rhabdastrellae]
MKNFGKLLIFIFGCTTAVYAQENKATLTIDVTNITEKKGTIYVELFSNEDNFLENAFSKKMISSFDEVGRIAFNDIPYGIYAVSIYHDVNDNGKMDASWLGMPKEPVGVSNNPGYGMPKWEETKFVIDNTSKEIKVRLKG